MYMMPVLLKMYEDNDEQGKHYWQNLSHLNSKSFNIKENNVLEHLCIHSWMNSLITVIVRISLSPMLG